MTLRLLTFNIHHGEGDDGIVDLERVAQVILSARPDIVCLQEVDRGLPRTQHLDFPALLADKLGMPAIFEPNYHFDGGEYGNAVFTALNVDAWENHPLPGPKNAEPRGCLEVQIALTDKNLAILNTHLSLDAHERELQVAEILSFLPNGNVCLAGDLNEVPEGKPVRPLLGRLADSFQVPASGVTKTFSTSVLARRIDFVLVSRGIRVLESRILNNADAASASDHLPYLVELELP